MSWCFFKEAALANQSNQSNPETYKPHDRYVCVGDFGSPFGYLVDWDLYMSFSWFKRAFGNGKNEATLQYGRRDEISALADEMNLIELKNNTLET